MENKTANQSQNNKATSFWIWKITGAIFALIGSILLIYTDLPFVFGLILILAGVMMFLKEHLSE